MFVFCVCGRAETVFVSVPAPSHHDQVCHTSHLQVMIDQFEDKPKCVSIQNVSKSIPFRRKIKDKFESTEKIPGTRFYCS